MAAGRLREGWRGFRSALASTLMILAVIAAVIFAGHIVFVAFKANQGNEIVDFVNRWAVRLAWGFKDLFTPRNARLGALANYGIAAVVYLIAGRIAAGIVRRLG